MTEGATGLCNARVLLVDDDADTLEVMKIILESQGAETAAATSAIEGLKLVRTFRPHLLVSDIAMPEEDGYSFLRKVRALPAEEGGETAAMAVSAHIYSDDRQRAYRAGFQSFLGKPINPVVFLECVRDLVIQVRRRRERRQAERRRAKRITGSVLDRRHFERRQLAAV